MKIDGKYKSIDLFCGCGGLTQGMKKADFQTIFSIDNNKYAIDAYKMNHPYVHSINDDIRTLSGDYIKQITNGSKVHLLAGCPPCQGFSSLRRLNKKHSIRDTRNSLILEYLRLIIELKPHTVMLENVPWIVNYYHFRKVLAELKHLGYFLDYKIVNVKDYGVAQSRERFVLVGSCLGPIKVALPKGKPVTVRNVIGSLETPEKTRDPLHKILPNHTDRIKEMIPLIPKNGGSRKDLPAEYILPCHKKPNIGFNDIYGRLSWDSHSTTITGGCLNPSKGRFLHPDQDRNITPREAALLQSFPRKYKFPISIPKAELALLIGNALPPKFSYYQSKNIKSHLDKYLD